jgi:iron complex outermembrane receptor protein
MNKNILLLLALLASAQLSAQSIRGTVRDALTRSPLPGATILQTGTQNGTTAGESGQFELALLPQTAPQLEIRFLGYRTEKTAAASVLTVYLYPETVLSEAAFVQATRVDSRMPMTFTTVSKTELDQQNLGKDLPFLVQYAPSVVQTSDAGTGIGYTGLRVRGVDPTRINVTINGVPLNDPESQNVFWVNTPDLASSTASVQLQRGVGTSSNGNAAFGATMNVETAAARPGAYGVATAGAGAFGTRRFNLMGGTGTRNGLNLEARLSYTGSDGYVDRASADLRSYFLQGTRFGDKSITKALVFGGNERTYQAWYGTPEARITGDTAAIRAFADRNGLTDRQRANLFNSDRRYNFYDYKNQVDDYQQHHAQLHHTRNLADSLVWNVALHYTRGKGFFEEFKEAEDLSGYGIGAQTLESDLARRRWLDNHFAGIVTGAEWSNGALRMVAGGGYNHYTGRHFGDVIRVFDPAVTFSKTRYYDNDAVKTDGNVYTKATYSFDGGFSVYGDVQVRSVYYRFLGFQDETTQGYMNDRLLFVNPKAGLLWIPGAQTRVYASYARGSREPGREEYTSSTPASRPRPEFLDNVEAGVERRFGRWALSANFYAMEYRDQLILTGQVNDVGAYIRRNVPNSYRRGIELMSAVQLNRFVSWSTSITLSRNKIREFTEFLDAYGENFEPLPQQTTVFRDTDIAFSPNRIINNTVRFASGPFSAEVLTKHVSRQYLDNRSDNANSIGAYTVHDLLLRWNMNAKANRPELRFSLQASNLLNTMYVSNGYTFGYKVGAETIREDFFYPQAGRHTLFQVQVAF